MILGLDSRNILFFCGANFPCGDDDAVDGKVDRYDLSQEFCLAVHAPDHTLAAAHQQPDGSVEVVHPPSYRLFH